MSNRARCLFLGVLKPALDSLAIDRCEETFGYMMFSRLLDFPNARFSLLVPRYYPDSEHVHFWGEHKYHGPESNPSRVWAGVGSHPPLKIEVTLCCCVLIGLHASNPQEYLATHRKCIAYATSTIKCYFPRSLMAPTVSISSCVAVF